VPLLVRWIRTRERLVVEGGATRGDSEELTVRAPRRPASPAGIATLGVPFSGRSEKKRDVAGLAQKEDLRVADVAIAERKVPAKRAPAGIVAATDGPDFPSLHVDRPDVRRRDPFAERDAPDGTASTAGDGQSSFFMRQ
jgi:hypothetical protein